MVVLVAPRRRQRPGLTHVGEHLGIEQFITQPRVEALGEAGWTHVQARVSFAYRSEKRQRPVQASLNTEFEWVGFFDVASVDVDADVLPVMP